MAGLDAPERLAEFKASILSLDGDPVLQACVERAAKVAEAPTAMVSFVMRHVQFFRAAVGLPAEFETTRATSRCHSFCQFVVRTEAPFVVTDAAHDERLREPRLDSPDIGAYAGVPIHLGGQILGSLCVADRVPRSWSPELVDELGGLARCVSDRLERLAAWAASEEDLTVVPPASLAARASRLAQILERSVAEIGPMVRLARGMAHGMSPDGLLRASVALEQASAFYDELMGAAVDLRVVTRRIEESVARSAGSG